MCKSVLHFNHAADDLAPSLTHRPDTPFFGEHLLQTTLTRRDTPELAKVAQLSQAADTLSPLFTMFFSKNLNGNFKLLSFFRFCPLKEAPAARSSLNFLSMDKVDSFYQKIKDIITKFPRILVESKYQ